MVEEDPMSNYYDGFYIGLDERGGKDFYMLKGMFHTVASKKAMRIMKKAKLTNVRFESDQGFLCDHSV